MVWLYRSVIPVGRRGVIFSFKLFLPAFATRGGGSVSSLWYYSTVCLMFESTLKVSWKSTPCPALEKPTRQRLAFYAFQDVDKLSGRHSNILSSAIYRRRSTDRYASNSVLLAYVIVHCTTTKCSHIYRCQVTKEWDGRPAGHPGQHQ